MIKKFSSPKIKIWFELMFSYVVPGVGLEPTSLAAQHFKCCAFAISPPGQNKYLRPRWELHPRIRVLQTLALLLGYVAVYGEIISI